MIFGCCECRRVRFEIDGEIHDFGHCHCSQCRRLHGAAFATFAGVERAHFRFVAGESNVKVYASSNVNDRIFCESCGSPIYVEPRGDPSRVYVSMGAIEGNPPRPRAYHAWVESKAPWHQIDDDLDKFDRDADTWEKMPPESGCTGD